MRELLSSIFLAFILLSSIGLAKPPIDDSSLNQLKAISTTKKDYCAITGTVKSEDGYPIPCAKVIAYYNQALQMVLVKSDGYYYLKAYFDQLPGLLILKASSSGFREYISDSIAIGIESKFDYNFILERDTLAQEGLYGCGSLSGRITDKEGIPLPGAKIEIFPYVARGDFSDRNGNYLVSGIPAGTQNVQAFSIGFKPNMYNGLVIYPDTTIILDFTLLPSPVILHSPIDPSKFRPVPPDSANSPR